MAKAKVIEGLHPHAETRASLPPMFATRIAELWDLAVHMPYPDRVRELHNMRIAAKRLRYLFEFFAYCFDDKLSEALKKFKHLQDYLGEVHDCDVWVDYLRRQLRDAFKELNTRRKTLDRFVGADADLQAEASALRDQLAGGPARGLLLMLSDVAARRARLYGELLLFWEQLSAEDFRGELTRAVAAAARGPEPALELELATELKPDEEPEQ